MRSIVVILFLFFNLPQVSAQELPQIYVHTDRSMYAPGDTVWFKAYLMYDGRLDSTIHNLYIDWADSAGNVLANNVHIASQGYSFSQFVVPADLSSSVIYLNAYTGNIEDKGYLGYTKPLYILGDGRQVSYRENTKRLVVSSGAKYLVQGMTNRIYTRGEDSRGLPFPYQLELLDGQYDVVSTTTSDSAGIAHIDFEPEMAGYMLRWKDSDGKLTVEQLPAVQPEGVLISLVQEGAGYYAILKPSAGMVGDYVLHARLNQLQLFEQPVMIKKGGLKIAITPDMLRYGLLQLSLVNSKGQECAYHSEVVQQEDIRAEPQVQILTAEKGPRAKQKINLSIPHVAYANLSVSIVDDFSLPDSSDRMERALLNSQVVGAVYIPSAIEDWVHTIPWNRDYSLIDELPARKDAALYVQGQVSMPDKGWKRFEASTQKEGTLKVGIPRGSLSLGYRPIRQDTVHYPFKYQAVELDDNRRIVLKDLQYFDTMEFRLSHIDRKNQFDDIKVDYRFKPFADHTQLTVPSAYLNKHITYLDRAAAHMEQVDAAFAKYLGGQRQIQTVVVRRKVKPLAVRDMEDKFMVTEYFKNSVADFLPQDDPYVIKYSTTLLDYIRRSKEINLLFDENENVRSGRFKRIYVNERKCYDVSDGSISIIDVEMLRDAWRTDMSRIGLIKIIQSSFGDELALYVFAASNVNRDLGRRINLGKLGGYTPIYQITNVDYGQADASRHQKDERQTLYWHPLLLTNSENASHATIEFYNNEFGRDYWIVIKGITAEGKLVDYTKKIKL
ncbi:hypothetical protein SAMN05660841_02034 [Sphingobacterium nematocida]|uniref:MG2 domain-containing protein n=1 Tax=Sphingobacterium nematocida TaxID=1513896 RepID=A0A1T5DKS4_9SPHI|nr:hypothetical protein [Sphingobacterium nematocida]SKB72063.1 hypothetical protein SAMN05660841_02034 [Sphingobacterium nematocida]